MKIKLFFIIFLFFLLSCDNQIPQTDEITTASTSIEIIAGLEPEIDLEFISMVKNQYPQITNLPVIYIQLDNDASFENINRTNFVSGTYTFVDGDTVIYEQPLEIKGRGNYSWSFPKKPYSLSLGTKADLLGNGQDAKRWVLVTTHSDKTMLRNYLTLTYAYKLGMEYSTECRYVDVFTNGEYNGAYVLTEKIQIHENRINIDMFSGALFEIEMEYRHAGNCHYCVVLPSGVHIMFVAPDEDDMTTKELDKKFIQLKSFLLAMDLSLSRGYSEYSQYIDVESFINWYILNEFVKNYDSNFTTSCYCFIGDDGKLYMGPAWDYDTCYGNQNVATCISPQGYHVQTAPWYTILMEDETFFRMLNERWTELYNAGFRDDFINMIYDTAEYISESEVLDHAKWTTALQSTELRGNRSLFTYDEELEYLVTWVGRRITWLNNQWNTENQT